MDAEVAAGRVKSRAKLLDNLLTRAQREAEYRREAEILRNTEETEDEKSFLEWIRNRKIPEID